MPERPMIPKPPDTPPGGGRRVKPMTEHAMIDLGELGGRTADKLNELTVRFDKIEPLVMMIPEMHTMMKYAVTPVARPRYVNYAIVACAIAAVVIATSSVVRTTTIIDGRIAPRIDAQK